MPITASDQVLYARLRKAIDEDNEAEIRAIFERNPALNWNTVTPNGLSALWWALIPPRGQRVNITLIVHCLLTLERNGQPAINCAQTYAGLRANYYAKNYLCDDQLAWRIENSTRRTLGAEGGIADLLNDDHTASNPIILGAADKNLKRLYTRYAPDINLENEIADIQAYLNSEKFKNDFPSLRKQRDQIIGAFDRIQNDTALRVNMNEKEGPVFLKQALALVWHAAKDQDDDVLAQGVEKDPTFRKRAVLNGMLESQTAYGLNHPSCWPGTWSRIGNALEKMHKDIEVLQLTTTPLPQVQQEQVTAQPSTNTISQEQALAKYTSLIGEALGQLIKNDRRAYWAVIRTVLLDDNNNPEDKRIYAEWTLKHADVIKQALEKEGASSADISFITTQMETIVPLSRHAGSSQLEYLQQLFNNKKSNDLFNSILEKTDQSPQEIIDKMKESYTKLMPTPPQLVNHSDIKSIKNDILKTLLENRESEEHLKEDTLLKLAVLNIQITEWGHENLTNWYRALSWPDKIALLNSSPDERFTPANVVEYALKNQLAEGLPLSGLDLQGIDARGCDLREMDLRGVNFQNADLRLMTAEGAQWDGCNTENALFDAKLFPDALIKSKHCNTDVMLQSKDARGETFLMYFIKQYDGNRVKELVNYSWCTPEFLAAKNTFGQNALHLAAQLDRSDILEIIISSNKVTRELLEATDNNGRTPVFAAATPEAIKLFSDLPECHSSTLINSHQDTLSKLQVEARAHDADCLKGFLNSRFCTKEIFEHQTSVWRKTALHFLLDEPPRDETSLQKYRDCFTLLLSSKHCSEKFLSLQDRSGNTFLHEMMRSRLPGNTLIIDSILSHPNCSPAFLNVTNDKGKTAFDLLIDNFIGVPAYHTEMVEKFITSPHFLAAAQKENLLGLTMFRNMLWLSPSFLDTVKIVLNSPGCTKELFAPTNTSAGNTVLQDAIQDKRLDLLKLILAAPGCTSDILYARNDDNETALDLIAKLPADIRSEYVNAVISSNRYSIAEISNAIPLTGLTEGATRALTYASARLFTPTWKGHSQSSPPGTPSPDKKQNL